MAQTALTTVLVLGSAAAFAPPAAVPYRPALLQHSPALAPPAMSSVAQPVPQPDGPHMPPPMELPQFSWRTVAFFALNPAALLPLAGIAALLKVQVLGGSFGVAAAMPSALLMTVPLLALSVLPVERLPGLSSLREVTLASKTISLYAMGGRLLPLRAVCAAALLSTSAAVCEELVFRGTLQTVLTALACRMRAPERAGAAFAVLAQGLCFGALHSYTASAVYFITATFAGVLFGAAFAGCHNLAVPIVMHFVLDFVSFIVCHVQVARSSEQEQRKLIETDSPIAVALRRLSSPPSSPDAVVHSLEAEGTALPSGGLPAPEEP